jgi:hypothetical protein
MSTVNNGPQIVRNGLILDLDASYMRSYSPNVYPNPTDLLATQYMGNEIQSCTVSRDTTITRQYGSIPMKMVITGNDAYAGRYGYLAANLASALNGQTWTISVYAKASVATDGQLFIFGADTNGAWSVTPDYSAGTIAITTSWQRFSFSYTFTNASTRYIQFRLDGTNTGGSGITIWWDGLQVERASAATNFNPYYFGNAVWKDVSSNGNDSALVNTDSQNYFSTNAGYIAFDGTNDYVSISSPNTNTRLQNNYQTISFFVYITSVGPNGCAFLYAVGGNANGISINWLTTFISIRISNGASNTDYTVSMTNALNTWMNITSIVDNVNRTMTVYKNGSLVGTSGQWSAFTPPSSAVTIGNISMTVNTGDYIKGRVANVLVYNRALTATEISQNYETDKSKFILTI